MIRQLILILILNLPLIAFSQYGKFIEGAIINSNNDTIPGFIRDSKPEKLAYEVIFSADSTYEYRQTIQPDSVKGFFISPGSYYASQELKLQSGTVHRFARLLIEGNTSLYRTYQNENSVFVLQKGNDTPIVLEKIDEVKDGKIHEDNRYKGILTFQLAECPQLKAKIQTMEYSERSFIKIISSYNACNSGSETMTVHPDRYKASFHFGPQLSYYGGTYSIHSSHPMISGKLNIDKGFAFGLVGEFDKKRFATQLAIQFVNYKMHIEDFSYQTSYINHNVDFSVTYLNLPISLSYNFYIGKFSSFIYGGPNVGFVLNQNATRYNVVVGEENIEHIFKLSVWKYGADIGVGFDFLIHNKQKLRFQLGYNYSTSTNKATNYANTSAILSLNMAYLF